MTGLKYIPLLILSLASIIWGLPASHRLTPPKDIGAAFLVLAGVVGIIISILLITIPNFFRS